MMSTDLISVFSRPTDRGTASQARRKRKASFSDDFEESNGHVQHRLSSDLLLDGPMPVFRRRGYYLDLMV